ncbi:MAG: hypothetical protein K0S33_4018, partial [Bacteroidetes bacterium]|nr:hypothetical protein [Bacteroidota bacterium]
NDDGFEWFGGTVNAKNIISYRNLDDDFDTDFGFRGHIQFGLIVRDPNIADQSATSTSEGFESDNDATGTENGPHTTPVFSNVTAIGPYRGSTSNPIDAKFRRALRIRRNSQCSVFNSIFTDFPTGLHVDGSASVDNALILDSLRFEHNMFAGMGAGKNLDVTSTAPVRTWFGAHNNDTTSAATAATIIVAPYNFTAADYRLTVGSAASTGADFSDTYTEMSCGAIGIKENNTSYSAISTVKLYPNPAAANVSMDIELATEETVSVSVYDITGKLVAVVAENTRLNTGTTTIQIPAAELSNGMYFVTVSTGKYVQTQKLIINK